MLRSQAVSNRVAPPPSEFGEFFRRRAMSRWVQEVVCATMEVENRHGAFALLHELCVSVPFRNWRKGGFRLRYGPVPRPFRLDWDNIRRPGLVRPGPHAVNGRQQHVPDSGIWECRSCVLADPYAALDAGIPQCEPLRLRYAEWPGRRYK